MRDFQDQFTGKMIAMRKLPGGLVQFTDEDGNVLFTCKREDVEVESDECEGCQQWSEWYESAP
jgi:hypothetical protein